MCALVRTLIVAVIASSSVNARVAALEAARVDESSPASRTSQVRLSEDELDPATRIQTRLIQDLRMAASQRRRAGDRRLFVIPANPITKEDHLAMERDMHIMSHIFDQVLKSNLIESLKHATNIQALRPDDAVILTVVGTAYPPRCPSGNCL